MHSSTQNSGTRLGIVVTSSKKTNSDKTLTIVKAEAAKVFTKPQQRPKDLVNDRIKSAKQVTMNSQPDSAEADGSLNIKEENF